MNVFELALKEIKKFPLEFIVQSIVNACFAGVAAVCVYFAILLPSVTNEELYTRYNTLAVLEIENADVDFISDAAAKYAGSALFAASGASFDVTLFSGEKSARITKATAGAAYFSGSEHTLFSYLEGERGVIFNGGYESGGLILSEQLSDILGADIGERITFERGEDSFEFKVATIYSDPEYALGLSFLLPITDAKVLAQGEFNALFYADSAENALAAIKHFEKSETKFSDASKLYEYKKQSDTTMAILVSAAALIALASAAIASGNFGKYLAARREYFERLREIGAGGGTLLRLKITVIGLITAAAFALSLAAFEGVVAIVESTAGNYYELPHTSVFAVYAYLAYAGVFGAITAAVYLVKKTIKGKRRK